MLREAWSQAGKAQAMKEDEGRLVAATAIEIRVGDLAQLFDPLDPSPTHRRALARSVASYILARAEAQGGQEPLRLVVYGPESLRTQAAEIVQGIQEHFRVAHAKGQRRFARRMRIGGVTLVGGLVVLALSVALRSLLRSAYPGSMADGIGEGLLILGWVAMWWPVHILLFEHFESHLDHAVLDRLARVQVSFSGNA
jgi:hypothetical protein